MNRNLTHCMQAALTAADLETAEITNVPATTLTGLEARGLVRGTKRIKVNGCLFRCAVKLTSAGLSAARALQSVSLTHRGPQPQP
jgi:hypothetical protein